VSERVFAYALCKSAFSRSGCVTIRSCRGSEPTVAVLGRRFATGVDGVPSMYEAALRFQRHGLAAPSGRVIDRYAVIPLLACVYATIAFPLIIVTCSPTDTACLYEARPESKIVWPVLAGVALLVSLLNWSRLRFPPILITLFAYLALAGLSVTWAFKPEISGVRFLQQAMIIIAIVLPAMIAARSTDLVRGLFWCFSIAAVLNLLFIMGRPPIDTKYATWGYPGYFSGKNYLGQCAAVAFLLAFSELLHSGRRRMFGIAIALMSVALLFLSNSKTALALAMLAPVLAWALLKFAKVTQIPVSVILISIPIGWAIFSFVTGFNMNRVSYILYGDPTFTSRTIIWDFANTEIAKKPLLGWGYQSFWLVGPDAPSIVNAPGWVKDMPNAHNGYEDTLLELGYLGLSLLLAFVVATVHGIGRLARLDFSRAWILLSIVLYVIVSNGLESTWMRGFEMLWIVFVIVAAEVARHWRQTRPVVARGRQVQRPGIRHVHGRQFKPSSAAVNVVRSR
jgi:exopolysaccharide production protein ExoQ